MPISNVWILKYVQQCYVKWFWTISSLGAPGSYGEAWCILMVHDLWWERLVNIEHIILKKELYTPLISVIYALLSTQIE